MTDEGAARRHRIVMAIDAGYELTDLIGAVPTRPPKPSLKPVLIGPRRWLADHLGHRSAEPNADLVRRICNQADAYADAANEIGVELGDHAVTSAAAALKQGATQLWSNEIDAMTLRSRSQALDELFAAYRRLL